MMIEKVCFMDVKPRAPRRDINCINCGECIEACNMELGDRKGLFSFSMPGPEIKDKKDDISPVNLVTDYNLPRQSRN